MPRSRPAAAVSAMPGAVFSPIAHRLAAYRGKVYPLHVGDTWLPPIPGARPQDFTAEDHPDLHRYSVTQGLPQVVDAVVQKVREANGLPAEAAGVLIAGGATGGLAVAASAVLDPGEEVIVLAPYWPLIRGIVQAARGVPVEVPFYEDLTVDQALRRVEAALGPRTVALYLATPSNPTGRVIPPEQLEALAAFARRHDLWILADEVYEHLQYEGEHLCVGRLAPERTLSAFSFSKGHGMAGHRVGYLVGPPAVMAEARKVSTHSFYCAPVVSQLAGLHALQHGQEWVSRAREVYRQAGDAAADLLGLPRPAGSTFLFLDVAPHLDDRGLWGFLEDCVEEGLVLAPGPSFGKNYGTFVRICTTSADPATVLEGVGILARRVGR